MSQPGTATTRIGTQPKNATQHPRHILTAGVGKRRTAAQKAADDQHDREAKEASKKALQEIYQQIATLQAQMQANQDAVRMDAPKPKHPCPCACPVGKAAQASKTSNSTIDGGHAGAEIIANKPIGTKGKGRECGCEADANTKHPETNEELEEPVTKTKRKKVSKQVVRDVIQLVLDTGIVIDGSTKARDGDVQKMSDVTASSRKFALGGRIPGWVSNIHTTTTVSRPTSKVNSFTGGTSTHPRTSTSFSKLTRGSTNNSDVPPPPTPIGSTTNAEGFTQSYSDLYASDEDDDLLTKPLSRITSTKAFMVIPEQPDATNHLDDMDVFSDIRNHLMDLNGSTPAMQPALADYKSDSDASHKVEVLDRDSDLEPPPLAQKPMSRSIFPPDFYLFAASQKRKMSPLLGDDDDVLMLSSEDESVECTNTSMVAVKTEPVEPVSMRRLTSSTAVAATLKAPPVKRLKTETSATTGTDAPCAIAAPSKAITRSAYRKKHLPKGCQMENKWAREFIPTAIRCIGDMDEVWTLADDILCPILQSVWDAVYKGKIPHTVVADGPAIALVRYFFRHYLNLTFF
ncbi:uncharacterized protein EDB91DRAFT_1060849 [Suillus paluster]|uniref:uncharacterized protein n=1 Tax=Suillus paluster TaxID=48578 RepID=UPI001B865250|nr:uncharacterized protein EDB91DRAFT_1060849 [Suillus paluster]KAG1727955.1 hypothetical protein EDB91DRAFT_1060849 [Suillus paluster]